MAKQRKGGRSQQKKIELKKKRKKRDERQAKARANQHQHAVRTLSSVFETFGSEKGDEIVRLAMGHSEL